MNIHSVAKYQKLMGEQKKFGNKQEQEKFEQSYSVEKKRKVSYCRKEWKGRLVCFGMAFYLMLEALDALKIKY